MKANRKFVEADEAVSPVIAVILMVAITVVLAATVFVLVSDIGSNTSKTQPSVGWAESEVDDEWNVNQAPQQVEWKAYSIKASGIGGGDPDVAVDSDVRYKINGGTATDIELVYQTLVSTLTMSGGDTVTFCIVPAATPETNVKITLLHIESNSVANEFTFLTIDTEC